MAQKAQLVLIDDLDGTPAQETASFGLDGYHHEIDLSAANARQLRGELRANVRRARATAPPAAPPRSAVAIRQWAQENGYDVSGSSPKAKQLGGKVVDGATHLAQKAAKGKHQDKIQRARDEAHKRLGGRD